MKNHNSNKSSFTNEDVKTALSWMDNLIAKTGTRLTGMDGCKKASDIIYQKLKEVCHTVSQQDFIHHRDAFLSFLN